MSRKWNFYLIIVLCTMLVLIKTSEFMNEQPLMNHVAHAISSPDTGRHASSSNSSVLLKEMFARTNVTGAMIAFPSGIPLQKYSSLKNNLIALNSQAGWSVPVKQSDKIAYLTFDDGPDNQHTKDVLNVLQQENVKGTFFVLGKRVEHHPELVKRIVEEGHALGNHSYNHNYSELYSNFSKFWHQIKQTGAVIKKTIGYEPVLVRAPGGTFMNFDKQYFDLMNQGGYFVHDWHVDSGDSRRHNIPAKEIIKNVKASSLLPSMVVLMHDGAGHRETAKALPEIIHYYKAKGYSFEVLSPDVKPFQFKIATKKRWSRTPISPAWIAANVKPVQAANSKDSQLEQGLHRQPYKSIPSLPELLQQQSQKQQKFAQVAKSYLRLELLTDRGKIEFAPEQFINAPDRIYVPLRTLVGQLNGTIAWNFKAQHVNVELNPIVIKIHVRAGKLEILGSPHKHGADKPQALDIVMQQGVTWVPLRQIIGALGVKLISYELSPLGSIA